jgi:ferredoxin
MRVRVDAALCNAHGLCQLASPAVFAVNPETGFNEAGEFQVPDSSAAAARAGANACPEGAITLVLPPRSAGSGSH